MNLRHLALTLTSALLMSCTAAEHGSTGASSSSALTTNVSTSATLNTDVTQGNLQVLTTADQTPRDWSGLTLTVKQIDIRLQGGDYVNVSSAALTLAPSQLENGVLQSLASVTVAAGTYDQLRVTLASVTNTLPDGSQVTIDFSAAGSSAAAPPTGAPGPSCPPEGPREPNVVLVPILAPVVITADQVTHLSLDLTALDDRALVPQMSIAQLDTAGSLSGVVTDASTNDLANTFVVVEQNGRVAGSALTDASGAYTIIGIAPGTYDIFAALPGYQPEHESAAIVANTALTQDLTLTVDDNTSAGQFPPSPPPGPRHR